MLMWRVEDEGGRRGGGGDAFQMEGDGRGVVR